jgi:hypothetical protein
MILLLRAGDRLMLHLVVCIWVLSIIQCARKIHTSHAHRMIDSCQMQTTRRDISLLTVCTNEISGNKNGHVVRNWTTVSQAEWVYFSPLYLKPKHSWVLFNFWIRQ